MAAQHSSRRCAALFDHIQERQDPAMNRGPAKNRDLHGNVPDSCPVALLLVDVVNAMNFEGAEPLVRQALQMAPRLAALKKRARAANIPAIYINDTSAAGNPISGAWSTIACAAAFPGRRSCAD